MTGPEGCSITIPDMARRMRSPVAWERKLVPEATLRAIRDRAMPPNEWLKATFDCPVAEAQRFFQDYADKTRTREE